MEIDWENILVDFDKFKNEPSPKKVIEIDWQNIKIEYDENIKIEYDEKPKKEPSPLDSPFHQHENEMDYSDSNTSRETTLSAMEFDMDEVLERNEFDPSAFENLIDFADPDALIDEEIDTDSLIEEVYDEVYEPSRNPMRKVREVVQVANMPYFCSTCTLDFPSEAYLVRHFNTKKHQRALNMEQRGKKVNQKRKYVRKNSCKMQQVQTVESLDELTNEEIELLEIINQETKNDSVKDFYENFDLELKMEKLEDFIKVD